MFPRLQYLHIHTNDLWAATPTNYRNNKPWESSSAIRSALPVSWTSNRVPRSFPQLQTLVLYPGNKEVCSLPDPAASGGHAEINGGELGLPLPPCFQTSLALNFGFLTNRLCLLGCLPASCAALL
jgi:hypothetical protein